VNISAPVFCFLCVILVISRTTCITIDEPASTVAYINRHIMCLNGTVIVINCVTTTLKPEPEVRNLNFELKSPE
jgi:hypothetical protein